MKVLRVDFKRYFWAKIKAKGMPPLPRCGHSMSFYEKARILIIYGGIDDKREVNNVPAYYTNMGIFDVLK